MPDLDRSPDEPLQYLETPRPKPTPPFHNCHGLAARSLAHDHNFYASDRQGAPLSLPPRDLDQEDLARDPDTH